ncbi:MAG: response regulator [Candidatus Ozemobacteraceae bacterium]
MNILVLDDREDGRYFLTALLNGNGHQVESVSNGADALEILRKRHFDLIISDILMPVMDGFQFCQKVTSLEALKDIPFIFYTATYTGPQDEEFALKVGADRFIRKPCDPAELMKAIREITAPAEHAKHRAAPPSLPSEEVLRLYSERLVRKLEQKMLETEQNARELDEEKRKFQGLVEELPLGIALMDQENRFIYLNPRFSELFGYALADLASMKDWLEKAFYDSRTRQGLEMTCQRARGFRDARKNEHPAPLNVQVRCRNGMGKQARIGAALLAGGNLMVTCEDVSEQVRLETKLRQAQKMESLATLAGGIAHDFNNILTAIIGFAELSELKHTSEGLEARSIEGILAAAQRAKCLVGQILAFSRQSEQERIPLALHLVAQEVLSFLRSTLPTNIEIREHLDRDAVVCADPTQMHQMLMNLCINAFHAMREKGGILELGMKTEQLSSEEAELIPGLVPGNFLHITIADTGCGMTSEVMLRIFDPYFSTKPEGEGTGLGLSVTHGIVKSHHGAIDVTSSPGVGSTFNVYLPVVEKLSEGQARAENEPISSGQERILFIDDEPVLATIGRKMLQILGYQAMSRSNPLEARDLFQRDPEAFDLVITDLTMPGMTGLELAVELRNMRPDIRLILCSGNDPSVALTPKDSDLQIQTSCPPETVPVSKSYIQTICSPTFG